MCIKNAAFYFWTGVTVDLEQSEYSVEEGETLTVCASITTGVSDIVLRLPVSIVEGTAEGLWCD